MAQGTTNNSYGPPGGGPSISVPALWAHSGDGGKYRLNVEERSYLAIISSIVRFRKGERLYGEGDSADAVFNVIAGVVKSYKTLPDERQHIVAFLFPDDLVGLAENGAYVNSAEAVTAVTAYRMPVAALEARLRGNPGLEFHVICRLCHDLRETQRHAALLSKRRSVAKVGLFLQMLETHQAERAETNGEIYLPMSRSDIGAYVGLSLEAVSRSFRSLASRGAITFRDRRHLTITKRALLEALVSETVARVPC